jgi:hypothetical protein
MRIEQRLHVVSQVFNRERSVGSSGNVTAHVTNVVVDCHPR